MLNLSKKGDKMQADRLVAKVFITMCFLVLQSSYSLCKILTKKDQLKTENIILNSYIAQYERTQTLSKEEQSQYVQSLLKFQQIVQELQAEGKDAQDYVNTYIHPYRAWAILMVSDKELLEKLKSAAHVQIVPVSANQSFDQLRIKKVEDLYIALFDTVSSAEQEFTLRTQNQLNSIAKESYSKVAIQSFTVFLQDQMQTFKGTITAAQSSVKGDYFAFLERHNQLPSDARDMGGYDREFLQNIDRLSQDSMAYVKAFMLDITSQAVKSNMIADLQDSFAMTQAQLQKIYDEQLVTNQQGLNRSWWTEVVLSGKDLLGDFSFEFKKELAKQFQEVITKQGGKGVAIIGHATIGKIGPVLAEKIKGLSASLKVEKFSTFLNSKNAVNETLKWGIRTSDPVVAPVLPVRVDSKIGLTVQEKTFIKNRMPKVQKVLEQEFGITQPLRIGFCCSGGGIRAMIGTLGIFTAAARSKILHATMYMAGLSGSTWMIAPWSFAYLNNKISRDYLQSLHQVRTNWETVLNDPEMIETPAGLYIPPALKGPVGADFSHQIAVRIGYGDTLSAVDLYGGMVGNVVLNLMGDDRLKVTWSSLASLAQHGDIPLPLCSAVFDAGLPQMHATGKHTQYEWFETGPFQAGSTVLGYVPIQYFGSDFKKGTLQTADGKLRPEYPVSFFQGVYGSAFGLSFNDVIDKGLPLPTFTIANTAVTIPVDEWLRNVLDEEVSTSARQKRSKYVHAQFANFSFDLATSALNNKKEIGLFDAGINFNFPLPLLTDRPQREVDLIFIYDSNPGDAHAFADASAYYARKGIAIPNLSKVNKVMLASKPMTVFNDPRITVGDLAYNPKAPTFIYFPTRSSMPVPVTQPFDGDVQNQVVATAFDITKAPYITPNFKYSPTQMGDLVDAMDYAFTSQLDEIKEVMKLVAQERHK